MILRHSALYFVARGVPGLIGLASVVIFTRLLAPESYGQYALVVSSATLCCALFYEWLNASLLRFRPQYGENPAELLRVILSAFLLSSLIIGVCGGVLYFTWGDLERKMLVLLGILLAWAQGWFKLNLDLVRSRLDPVQYGIVGTLKAVAALILAVLLIKLGYDVYGVLLGLIVGFTAAGYLASRNQWSIGTSRGPKGEIAMRLLVYGLPLTASFVLTAVITSTDRFMIAALMGEMETGLYTAGQTLATQAVGVSMTMISLAAYPIIVRTLEERGSEAAQVQLNKNAILLMSIGIPIAILFVALAHNISAVFLGVEFRQAGAELMPWFAVAALLTSIRTFYFDLAFYLGKKTGLQLFMVFLAAGTNVALNLIFIPAFGLLGAAYASIISHIVAVVVSATLGRRSFPLVTPFGDMTRIVISGAVMIGVLLIMPAGDNILSLILSCTLGCFVYASCYLLLNPGGAREHAVRSLRQVSSKQKGQGSK